jgi:hypothetical protein
LYVPTGLPRSFTVPILKRSKRSFFVADHNFAAPWSRRYKKHPEDRQD